MRSVTPSIESAVSRLAPGFRALSIVVESAPVADPAVAEQCPPGRSTVRRTPVTC